mgnify:FL=1
MGKLTTTHSTTHSKLHFYISQARYDINQIFLKIFHPINKTSGSIKASTYQPNTLQFRATTQKQREEEKRAHKRTLPNIYDNYSYKYKFKRIRQVKQWRYRRWKLQSEVTIPSRIRRAVKSRSTTIRHQVNHTKNIKVLSAKAHQRPILMLFQMHHQHIEQENESL